MYSQVYGVKTMSIVEEVKELLERKASKEALEWGAAIGLFDKRRTSSREVLHLAKSFYDGYIKELKRWLDGISSD